MVKGNKIGTITITKEQKSDSKKRMDTVNDIYRKRIKKDKKRII